MEGTFWGDTLYTLYRVSQKPRKLLKSLIIKLIINALPKIKLMPYQKAERNDA
jgi:hypothetical protein